MTDTIFAYLFVLITHIPLLRLQARGKDGFFRSLFLSWNPVLSRCRDNRFLLALVGVALTWSAPANSNGPLVLAVAAGILCAFAEIETWLRRREGRARL